MKSSRFRSTVFLFFFLSGATGIIYEVVWTRLLTLVMGNTHFSISTVLTAFMGGLALGSFWGGRFIDRKDHPLLIYGILEAIIGVYCLLIPVFIDWATPLFESIYLGSPDSFLTASLLRFLVCGAILMVPTTLMGATLPVLSKVVTNDPNFIGKDVGTLYAMNTFGAVAGALGSGFFLLKWLGVSNTIFLAAFINIGIGGVIFALFRKSVSSPGSEQAIEPQADEDAREIKKPVLILVLVVFGLSGLTALVYQVAWTRIFSLLLGSSVYAFSLILATFIFGLALGTTAFARWGHRFTDLFGVFGWTQIGIAVSVLGGIPFFAQIPLFNRWVFESIGQQFWTVQMSNFVILSALLLIPTFLMGIQFPLVVKIVARRLSLVGREVGRVYSSNTLGTILGAFLGGFVLIPWLGIQTTLMSMVFLNLALGLILLASRDGFSFSAKKAYVLPALFLVVLLGARSVGPWDRAVISSGSFMPYRIEELSEAIHRRNKILYYKEGIHTTVTTELATSGNIFLRVNGKTDASLALDMRTQLLSGFLPMFFHERPQKALVIGQGSGITLGAVERFPVKSIDLVEISPSVIEGSKFFSPFNHNALDDPRVRVVLEDGRNHLALTEKTYDVIISEPSNPWISGVGALFTREFFEIASSKLNPGGILCIWVHTNMSPDNFKSITRTFGSVFPHVSMWESIVGDDYLLIGSNQPYRMNYGEVGEFLQDRERGGDLWKIGIRTVRDLVSLMMMDQEGLKRFSGDAPIHTDDNSLLEFNTPEYIYKDERDVLVRQIDPYVQINPKFINVDSEPPEEQKRILKEMAEIPRSESQIEEIKRKARIDVLLDEAQTDVSQGDLHSALAKYGELMKLEPDHILGLVNAGHVYLQEGQGELAEAAYKRAVEINPYYLFGYVYLAKLYLAARRMDDAEKVLRRGLKIQPRDEELHLHLGLVHSFQDKPREAIGEWQEALNIRPDYALAHYFLGVQYQKGEPGLSRKHLRAFLDLVPDRAREKRYVDKAEKILQNL